MPLNLVVAGNIAAGKSTLCKRLRESLCGSVLVSEPVEKWTEMGMLGEFYRALGAFDRGEIEESEMAHIKWHFQYTALFTRVANENRARALGDSAGANFVIFDSHRHFDRAFTEDIREVRGVDVHRWYHGACDDLDASLPHSTPDVVVHLATPPSACMRNISRRGRDCETDMRLDYLERLHERISGVCNEFAQAGTKVLTVNENGNLDATGCCAQVFSYLQGVKVESRREVVTKNLFARGDASVNICFPVLEEDSNL